MYVKYFWDVVMVMYGIVYIVFMKVGNDFVCGVSGGEWKCVSIVEVIFS